MMRRLPLTHCLGVLDAPVARRGAETQETRPAVGAPSGALIAICSLPLYRREHAMKEETVDQFETLLAVLLRRCYLSGGRRPDRLPQSE
jgi:hypothetical protein